MNFKTGLNTKESDQRNSLAIGYFNVAILRISKYFSKIMPEYLLYFESRVVQIWTSLCI